MEILKNIKLIQEALIKNEKELTEVGIKNYKKFTNEIKIIIGDLGEALGYEVATNCCKEFNEKEWLFDLVWYKVEKSDTDYFVTSVDLILESEISGKKFGDFKTDFDKLLISTNSTKIMIFSKVKSELPRIFSYIKKTMEINQDLKKGQKIHLILWDENDSGKFEFINFIKD